MWHRHRSVLVSPQSGIDRVDLKMLENTLTQRIQQDEYHRAKELNAISRRVAELESLPKQPIVVGNTPRSFEPTAWRVWTKDRGNDGRGPTDWWTRVTVWSINPGPYDPDASIPWCGGTLSQSQQLRLTWRRKYDVVEVQLNGQPPMLVTVRPVLREWQPVDAPGFEGQIKVRFE